MRSSDLGCVVFYLLVLGTAVFMYDVGILSRCVGSRHLPPRWIGWPCDGGSGGESPSEGVDMSHVRVSDDRKTDTTHEACRSDLPQCHSYLLVRRVLYLSRPGEVGRIMSAWLKGAGSAEASEAVQWAAVGQGRSRDA